MRALWWLVWCGLPGLSCGPAADHPGAPRAPVDHPAPTAAPASDQPPAPVAPSTAAPPPTEATALAPPPPHYADEYVACGCGCCGGAGGVATREKAQCVSAEQLAQIRGQDAQARDNPQCAVMGCSLGTRYAVCD